MPIDDSMEDFAPRARYNAMTCVQKGILYIYGGILEIEDKEFTLDDFWSINVEKMTEYTCMKSSELDEQIWLGEQSDDDDDDDEDEDDDEDDEDEDDEDDEAASGNDDDENESVGSKAKKRKSKKKDESKKDEEKADVVIEEAVPEVIEEEDEQTPAMNKLNQLLEQDVSSGLVFWLSSRT
jgi:hypothetical protein